MQEVDVRLRMFGRTANGTIELSAESAAQSAFVFQDIEFKVEEKDKNVLIIYTDDNFTFDEIVERCGFEEPLLPGTFDVPHQY